MSDFLLTQIINYGAPLLGAVVFIGALGVPIPGTFIVIAAGAFSRQGLLPWHTAGLIALACVVIADCLTYALGYYTARARPAPLRQFGEMAESREFFPALGRHGCFLTRFLITTIATPVNIIAGTSNLRFRTFFIYDVIGEAIWIFGYGGLGYLFGSQWEAVSEFLSSVSGFLVGLIILAIGVWLARTYWRKNEAAKEQVPDL